MFLLLHQPRCSALPFAGCGIRWESSCNCFIVMGLNGATLRLLKAISSFSYPRSSSPSLLSVFRRFKALAIPKTQLFCRRRRPGPETTCKGRRTSFSIANPSSPNCFAIYSSSCPIRHILTPLPLLSISFSILAFHCHIPFLSISS